MKDPAPLFRVEMPDPERSEGFSKLLFVIMKSIVPLFGAWEECEENIPGGGDRKIGVQEINHQVQLGPRGCNW